MLNGKRQTTKVAIDVLRWTEEGSATAPTTATARVAAAILLNTVSFVVILVAIPWLAELD